jgi:hypothetical protein
MMYFSLGQTSTEMENSTNPEPEQYFLYQCQRELAKGNNAIVYDALEFPSLPNGELLEYANFSTSYSPSLPIISFTFPILLLPHAISSLFFFPLLPNTVSPFYLSFPLFSPSSSLTMCSSLSPIAIHFLAIVPFSLFFNSLVENYLW